MGPGLATYVSRSFSLSFGLTVAPSAPLRGPLIKIITLVNQIRTFGLISRYGEHHE